MKVTQMPPVHVANLVANSGNTAYGVDVICQDTLYSAVSLICMTAILLSFGYHTISIPYRYRLLLTTSQCPDL